MRQPLVSILIPAYNAEKVLLATIQSALAQTWPSKEIIVVDDGSRDGTLALARSLESAEIKVIAQQNRGQSCAENTAIRAAQGELFEFLDADDLMDARKLEVQIRRLDEIGYDCVASGKWARFVHEPGDVPFVEEPFWRDMDPVDWLATSWRRCSMMHGAAWLVPRLVAESAGPWDESLSLINDLDYFPRVLLNARRVLFCPEAVTWYRSGNSTSLSGYKSDAAWDSALRAMIGATSRLLEREDSARTRLACAANFQRFVYDAYPSVPQMRRIAMQRVRDLGGCDDPPPGGPVFQRFARWCGWKGAKRLRLLAESIQNVNGAR